jgi:hypothetical protein
MNFLDTWKAQGEKPLVGRTIESSTHHLDDGWIREQFCWLLGWRQTPFNVYNCKMLPKRQLA